MMKRTIRDIKRGISNFARRPRPERVRPDETSDEGKSREELLAEKCAIINRNLFWESQGNFEGNWLSPEKLLETMKIFSDEWNVFSVPAAIDACEHLTEVLTYLIGEDRHAERPASLAVYDDSKILADCTNIQYVVSEFPDTYDYESESFYFLNDFFSDYLTDEAPEEVRQAIIRGEKIDIENLQDYDENFLDYFNNYISDLPGEALAWSRLKSNHEAQEKAEEVDPHLFDIWSYMSEDEVQNRYTPIINPKLVQDAVRSYFMWEKFDNVFNLAKKTYKDLFSDKIYGIGEERQRLENLIENLPPRLKKVFRCRIVIDDDHHCTLCLTYSGNNMQGVFTRDMRELGELLRKHGLKPAFRPYQKWSQNVWIGGVTYPSVNKRLRRMIIPVSRIDNQ